MQFHYPDSSEQGLFGLTILIFCTGNTNEHTGDNSQANSARAQNKPGYTMSAYCGVLSFILPQWRDFSCIGVYGSWLFR
jgi:hypothetical protein